MVDSGLINYCERQSRDGSPKSRRLAEASVSILKLSSQLPSIGDRSIESVILELYPGYLDQKIQAMSRSFLTSTTVDKINLSKLKERQTKLLKITVSMGLVLLQIGKHTPALVAAQQYLVLAADIYGTNSLELIPAYLLIAEVSIQLNKLREAEQQLQKANWVVMRNENEPTINNVKQRLSRLLGLLQAAKGNKDESIRLFSEQIYFASMMAGTESVGASSGYYNLGNIIESPKVKNSLYLKALECWRELIEDQTQLDQMSEHEVYENLKMLDMLSKHAERIFNEGSEEHMEAMCILLKLMKIKNIAETSPIKDRITNIIQTHNITNDNITALLA